MRHRVWVAGILALALGLSALLAWPIAASIARSAVAVYPDGRAIICDKGKVSVFAHDEDTPEESFTQSVAASRGLDCELRFHVINNSSTDVYLIDANFEAMGVGGGGSAIVDLIDGQAAVAGQELGDSVLAFKDPLIIEPGENFLLVAHLSFDPEGCMSPGGGYTQNTPTISVSALGIDGTVKPAAASFSVTGTNDSSCDG